MRKERKKKKRGEKKKERKTLMSAFCEERHYCLRFIIFAFLQWRTRRQTKGCHGTKRREVKEIRSCCRCSRKGAARFFFLFFSFRPIHAFFHLSYFYQWQNVPDEHNRSFLCIPYEAPRHCRFSTDLRASLREEA